MRREEGAVDAARNFPALPFPSSFYKPQEADVAMDTKFQLFATSVYRVVRQHAEKRSISNLSASQKRGLKELRDCVKAGKIRLSISDKGGEFVVIPQELDKAITKLHLSDESLYCKSSEKEYKKQYRKLNRTWCSVAKTAGLANTTISRLKCDLPACPVLYVLIKTHKLTTVDMVSVDLTKFKVRPIVSGVGGPTDRISWFLNIILGQLLRYIPAHLTNTTMLLNRLSSASFHEGCVMESFDVTSLYTNVSNEAALEAIYELLCEHEPDLHLHGFTVTQVMTILAECLECSFFRWSGEYYKQLRSLAMGQRLAPVLAIAFMSRIEKPVLDRGPILYYRYIDDCLIICSTQEEMDNCYDLLNEQSQNINFTREKPVEDWLPFFNIQVQVRRGIARTKWYHKPSCKNIIVHSQSAHPIKTKQAVVNNMFRVANKVSSDAELKKESLHLAQSIASLNGYPCSGSIRRRYFPTPAVRERAQSDKAAFCLPFISEEVSRSIRSIVRRCGLQDDIRIVEIPPNTLRKLLVRSRLYDTVCDTPDCVVCPHGKVGDCMKVGVVYSIRCQSCGCEYVGETGRPLCVRVKEHLTGLAGSRMHTPLGAHRVLFHAGASFGVSVSILALEPEIAARKTLEALWITAKEPLMNRKEECVAITRELAPFLDLCNF
uniref:Reverse transcriptase domain-containing protein n=1 Tax=Haemonchus contortus TaxID=6289 RepID=A0A7I4Y5W9_HAECO